MKRAEVLRLAEKCVCGGRDSDYGTPEDNFGTIAKLWTIYCSTTFTAKDVAMMMALLKIARIRSGRYSADSYVDLAGYAACACEIVAHTEKNEGADG